MKIKTIACDMDNSRIYISDQLWKHPKAAIRQGRLFYLGMLGWYPNSDHKKLYEVLDDQFKISKMYPGEYMEADINWDNEWIDTLYGILIVKKNTKV